MNENSNPLYRPLAVGDWVTVARGEEYGGLSGVVTEVRRLGSPEHDTGNRTDDIIVDLSVLDYSDSMKDEINALMNELGYEIESFDDVSIDSVILAPEDLIHITDDELVQYHTELAASMERAYIVGETLSTRHFDEIYKVFTARVEQNYADYEREMLGFGAKEIYDMASRIHAVSDAYSHLTVYHHYTEEELRFYLQFQNPLDIVAQAWHERNMDVSDMSFTTDFLCERRGVIEQENAFINDAPPEPEQTEPSEKPKQQPPASKQPPSLLGEVREAAREVEARKAAQTAPTTTKSNIKKENEL